ncbi:uncharacterized protein LOC126797380 [Argentina anserina]|uniref:uncharacterized protein LOC126797380 n=1 Tax=Argentina anserina TaxID=57926 RepID=UPI002176901C|nr:uncharacterized protein LOC126797380 [Potentilla anserina]
MSSTPGNLKATLAGRTKARRRLRSTRGCDPKAGRSFSNGGEGGGRRALKCSKVVSAKLETLKNLIPNGKSSSASAVQADKLFQDTAEYILLLRTQVVVLQKLIEVYGSSGTEKEDNTNAAVL